jgi:hypothetical protein
VFDLGTDCIYCAAEHLLEPLEVIHQQSWFWHHPVNNNNNNNNNPLINFQKCSIATQCIRDVVIWQHKPYNLESVPMIFNYLTQFIEIH